MIENQAMLDAKELARRLVAAMNDPKDGVSSVQLASKCKVTPQAVNGWRKTGRISKRHLKNISEATHRALTYFLDENAESEAQPPAANQERQQYAGGSTDPRIGVIAGHYHFLTEPQKKQVLLEIKSMADANRLLLKQLSVNGKLSPPPDEYVDKMLNHKQPRRRRKYGKNV